LAEEWRVTGGGVQQMQSKRGVQTPSRRLRVRGAFPGLDYSEVRIEIEIDVGSSGEVSGVNGPVYMAIHQAR